MKKESIRIIKMLTLLELPLDKTISITTINQNYRKLAKIYHPDLSNTRYTDGAKFIDLKEAQEYLTSNLTIVNKMISMEFKETIMEEDNKVEINLTNISKHYYNKAKKEMGEFSKKRQEKKIRKEQEKREFEKRQQKSQAQSNMKHMKTIIKASDEYIEKIKEYYFNIDKQKYYEEDVIKLKNISISYIKYYKQNRHLYQTLYSLDVKYNSYLRRMNRTITIERYKKIYRNGLIASFISIVILIISIAIAIII